MPEWVWPYSQPDGKVALFLSRLEHLRGAVKRGEDQPRLQRAAEKLRQAQMSVIKAKLALVREYPQRDTGGRHLQKLLEEQAKWQSLDAQSIIEQHGRSDQDPYRTPYGRSV